MRKEKTLSKRHRPHTTDARGREVWGGRRAVRKTRDIGGRIHKKRHGAKGTKIGMISRTTRQGGSTNLSHRKHGEGQEMASDRNDPDIIPPAPSLPLPSRPTFCSRLYGLFQPIRCAPGKGKRMLSPSRRKLSRTSLSTRRPVKESPLVLREGWEEEGVDM
jgi:hypothetical protein